MKHLFIICFFLLSSFTLSAHAATIDQENLVWYRLHLGMGIGDMAVSPSLIHAFIDQELTPAFPNGFTITESRGQWNSQKHGLIRERTTVIDVQCADTEENRQKIEAIGARYVEKFKAAQASFFIKRIAGISTTHVH